jgi:hypothetical protein
MALQKVLLTPNIAGYSIVSIGNFAASASSGATSITLPGLNSQTFTANQVKSEYIDENNYSWMGNINGQGDVFLAAKDGGNIGFINIKDAYYFLHPLGGNKCALVKQNSNSFPLATCGNHEVESMSGIWTCANTPCASTIDVLILVSTEANTWLNNNYGFWKGLYLWVGTEVMNFSLANSGVPNTFIRPTYLFDVPFSYSFTIPNEPVGITSDELTFYTDEDYNGNYSGFNTQVKAWRDYYHSDLVIFLTNRGYGISSQPGVTVFGAAISVPTSGSGNYDYRAIVEAPYLFAPHFTMAHELSHLFGCNHSFVSPTDCPNAHHFNDADGFGYKTIVASGSEPGTRILRYSNPAILYNGVPTGIISASENANNALQMKVATCDVAEYRTNPFKVGVSGMSNMCIRGQQEGYEYKAIITTDGLYQPILPPYSYQWQISSDGNSVPYTDILGGTSSKISFSYPPYCDHFDIRVRVTGSNWNVVAYSHSFGINTSHCFQCGGAEQRNSTDEIQNSDQLLIPNPNDGRFCLNFDSKETSEISLDLINLNGQILKNEKFSVDFGKNEISLDFENLPIGSYFVRITSGKFQKVERLVIIH